MCDEVRDELKKLNYARYRFVVSGQTSDLVTKSKKSIFDFRLYC